MAQKEIKQLNFDDVQLLDLGLRYYDGEVAFADKVKSINLLSNIFKVNLFALIFCVNGKLSLRINSVAHSIKKDDGLFVDAQSVISDISHDDDFECKIVGLASNVGLSFVSKGVFETFMTVKMNPVVHFTPNEMSLLGRYYELVDFKLEHRNMFYGKEGMRNILQAYVLDLITCVNAHIENDPEAMMRQGDKLFRRFVLMLAGSGGTERGVKYYADQLCVSSKYLTSICTKNAHLTASELITMSVVNRIKQMLLYSDASVKEIAAQMKFENLSFFGKYVKKHLGHSPNHFRRLNNYGK